MSDAAGQSNALIHESSPYLLQHAYNPVDWHPWGEQAFALARRENKPIFLSVGYSTCYWCHVMERQVFERDDIAALMNEVCVNIKVDREERPDVDDIYMTATQAMAQRGGWPMSVFLTPPGAAGDDDDPGLKPFFAGTYFPPQPGHGLPSFPQVLQHIQQLWTQQREQVLHVGEQLAKAITQHLQNRGEPGPVDIAVVQSAARQLLRTADLTHGGLGSAPKFPTPNNLLFLLAVCHNNPTRDLLDFLRLTLDRMLRGGMYDQIGGGFHRYSVDEHWLVPHFEKMLYDNGQLLELYATMHRADVDAKNEPRQEYERAMRETATYVLREMTDETGLFHSAQDAEVNAREGGNYVWTRQQVEQAIEDETLRELAVTLYGLDRGPNFQDPHHPQDEPVNVLYLPQTLAELAASMNLGLDELLRMRKQINAVLYRVRATRDQPALDDKAIISWNGMMIAGLAQAGRQLDETAFVEAAGRAAHAILQEMRQADGGLYRTMRQGQTKQPAFLEDYAHLIHGLLALYRADQQQPWLDQASDLVAYVQQHFAAEQGGHYDTLANQLDLFVRTRNVFDGAVPGGNSVMVHNLLDLYELTGHQAWLDAAVRDVRSFATSLKQYGGNMAHMQHALLRALAYAPDALGQADTAASHAATGAAFTAAEASVSSVKVSVEPEHLQLAQGENRLRVTLEIAPGVHVHAHEPGVTEQTGLIGTKVTLAEPVAGIALAVEYPAGEKKQYPFAGEPIAVYEARAVIDVAVHLVGDAARLKEQRSTLPLAVRFQPCTEQACEQPQTVELTVRLDG